MNYVKLSLSLSILISTCVNADYIYYVRLLDQKKIDQHAISIEKKVTRDYYIRTALVGMVAARIAYGFVTWLNTPHVKIDENLIPTQKPKDATEIPKLSWSEWACNKKTAWIDWGKYVVSTENMQKQAIDLGKFVCANGIQMGMGFVMEGVYGKLNYPNTLRWYICSHAPYAATIKVIKEILVPLQESSSLTLEELFLLRAACNRLVTDGEKLCGYMTYKTKQLDIEEQQIAERTTRYFVTYYNEFLKRLGDELAFNVFDYNTIDTMLTTFETDIKRQCKLFFFIEGETDEERAMIGERMKRSLVIEHIATLF
jgi:hypothetical protein